MVRFPIFVFGATLAFSAYADPNPQPYENWITDFAKSSVDAAEIISGGPPKDGIPAIDDPQFVAVAEANTAEREPVIALEIAGDARAYPLSVLTWHEIANDTVGGQAVTVTFCPLCNAAIVFSRQVEDRTLDFGTTGRLRNSDLIMYDRQTESWWQQFSGSAILGELTGKRLDMVASTVMPFARFRALHPQGRVLVPNDPSLRRYGVNPYAYYDTSDRPFLYRGELPEGIDPMERVIIADGPSGPIIITAASLQESGTATTGDMQISWQPGMASALDSPKIADGRDVGYVTVTIGGEIIPVHVTFAFVAHAFHPGIEIRN